MLDPKNKNSNEPIFTKPTTSDLELRGLVLVCGSIVGYIVYYIANIQ